MRFIHINEYEYMNNNVQYINLHTRIRICIYVAVAYPGGFSGCPETPLVARKPPPGHDFF